MAKTHAKAVHKALVHRSDRPKTATKKTIRNAIKDSSSQHANHHTNSIDKIRKAKIKAEKTKKVHKKLYRASKRFCPNCGKEIHDDNTFCKDCRTTDFDFKEIKLLLCTNCMSYSHKNKWQKFSDLNKVLHDIVKSSVK